MVAGERPSGLNHAIKNSFQLADVECKNAEIDPNVYTAYRARIQPAEVPVIEAELFTPCEDLKGHI